jgi:hypothetical protein
MTEWFKAAQKEYDTADKMETWTIIPRSSLPKNSNVITCKWVFKRKHDELGNPTDFKARITPHGFKQIGGIDYGETYAQVGMYKTFRVLLQLAAMYDLELEQLDVPSAFLNAPLDEDIYMEIPEGFEQEGMIMKLLKALYGLKQGPRCWWLLISNFIVGTLGYIKCISDACFFYKKSRNDNMMYLYLFVDDFQSAFSFVDTGEWSELKQKLISEFNTKDLGSSVWMLGMRIIRDRINRTIVLDQEAYVTKALERFDMQDSRILSTPGESIISDELNDELDKSSEVNIKNEYQRIVGTLLYAATSTRIDIAHAVGRLSFHLQSPSNNNLNNSKRVLRYLNGCRNVGLKFGGNINGKLGNSKLIVEAYSDADWANDTTDRKSISGWIIKLCGSPIVWKSKKQRSVALSTCEAELYAAASAIQDVMWLIDLLKELGLSYESPCNIWCDNESTVQVSKNNIKTERIKHVSTRYAFIVDESNKGVVLPRWISTTEQQADILTKSVGKIIFEKFRNKLMIMK